MDKIQINQINENEYYVGNERIVFIDKKIIHVTASGEHTSEMAALNKKLVEELLNNISGKVNFLIDVNKAGKISQESIKYFKNNCYHPKIDKTAIYGLSPVARVIAAFVIGLNSIKNQQFFKTKEQAMSWLTENK